MVERAADSKLDGYRELGAKLAAAEAEIERLRADNDLICMARDRAKDEWREVCEVLGLDDDTEFAARDAVQKLLISHELQGAHCDAAMDAIATVPAGPPIRCQHCEDKGGASDCNECHKCCACGRYIVGEVDHAEGCPHEDFLVQLRRQPEAKP
jgi:hypothetical protein